MRFDYFNFFFCFPSKNIWILLTNILIIYHLIIEIFDSLTFILHPSKILSICFYFITFLIQNLLWRDKHQKTGFAIKWKQRKSQAPKDLLSLEVVDHSEGGNSIFVSCRFFKSLMHNGTIFNHSTVCTCGKQMRLKLFYWDITAKKRL